MQLTTNFKLKKIELADSPPDITVLNPNWDSVDTNLYEALTKSRDWNKFKNSGGTMNGPLRMGGTNAITVYQLKSISSGDVIWTDDIYPSTRGEKTLGNSEWTWKDIFLNAVSKRANGYTKLPNGLILQWGKNSFGASTGGGTVTMPLSFPTECYTVLLTNVYANSKAVVTSLGGTETTLNSFYVYLQDVISNARPNYTCVVSWMAIGS